MGIWFQSRRRHIRRHLLLQQLEDRVVLDASINPVQQDNQVATDNVGVADPVENAAGNAPATTGDGIQGGTQASPNGDSLSQVYGQNLNEVLVTNAPDQVESVQATATDQSHDNARVLVVSSTLSGANVLAAAAQPGVITVTFDGYQDTPGQILSSIEAALQGKKAESIALAAHDVGDGQFHLSGAYTVSLSSVVGDGEVHAFFEGLGNFLTADGRIDLLACNVTASGAGAQLVGAIEGISGHDVAASVDATGNPASGGDWILEDGNINVASLYFDPQTLSHYDGILVNSPPVLNLGHGAGSLDLTFSGDGKVITPIGTAGDTATSVAIQADGKTVVAGYSFMGSSNAFALVRYNGDGSLDTTFSDDGIVTTTIGSNDVANSVAIQADGKIVVAGSSMVGSSNDFALVRYNSDGSLDTSFDVDGIVTTPIGSASDTANAVAIQADGKIVVAGYSMMGSINEFALVRYNSDGSLDTTFDVDGKVTTLVGSTLSIAKSVAIQADGKIVAAGYSQSGGNASFALVRYNSNGGLDTSFDVDGKVTTPVGSISSVASSVAIQADGKIVAAGTASSASANEFGLARYNSSDGSLDTSFGGDGTVTTTVGSTYSMANSLAIQGDGKIVVAGSTATGSNDDFALARYNSDGTLDVGFGGDGTVMTPVGSLYDMSNSLAIQADGKIVVAGHSYNGSNYDFALVRYDASPLTYTENSGPVVIDSAITITDSDSANMASATIQITGNYQSGQDVLNIDSGYLLGGVTKSWDSVSGTLTLTNVTTAANYESMLEHVTYANTSSDPSTAVRTVTWTVNDGLDNSAAQASAIAVQAVNQAPTASDTSLLAGNYNEDQVTSSPLLLSGNPGEPSQTLTFHFADFSSLHGKLYRDVGFAQELLLTSTITAPVAGPFSGPVYFKPDSNYNGPMSFQYYVTDNGDGANQSANATASAYVIPQNDGPSISLAADSVSTTGADIEFTSTSNTITISDVEGNPGTAVMKVRLVASHGDLTFTGGTAGLYFYTGDGLDDTEMVFSGTIDNINMALEGLIFDPTDAGPSLGSLLISVADSGRSGMGGEAGAHRTVDIFINSPGPNVNDAPVNLFWNGSTWSETPFSGVTVAANGLLTFSAGTSNQIKVSDADAGSETIGVTLTANGGSITLASTTGLYFSNGDGTNDGKISVRGTLTAIETAMNGMSFRPFTDYIGQASLQISTNDQGHTGSGHPKGDNDTVPIMVTGAQDQPPMNTIPTSQTTPVNTPITFSGSGKTFSIFDNDAGATDMRVTVWGAHGTVTLSGTTGLSFLEGTTGPTGSLLVFTGSMLNINNALNGLVFTPESGYQGWADVGISTSDMGHTGLQYTGWQGSTGKVDIIVGTPSSVPVNVGPTITSGHFYTTMDETPVTFDLAHGNQISIADPDVGSGPLGIKIVAVNGTVSLNETPGVTIMEGDGTGDRTVWFKGTLENLNAALDGMTFTPLPGYSGAAYMNLFVSDVGNSGTGGPYTAAVGINFWVYAAGGNDAPYFVGLSNSSVMEHQPSGATVGLAYSMDPDGIADTRTYSLVSGTGDTDNASFLLDGNTLKTAASFDYNSKNEYSIRMRVTDVGGLWYEEALTVNVTDVNETPTVTEAIPDVAVAQNAPPTVFSLYPYFQDVEDSDAQLTYTVVNNTNPSLFAAVNISDPTQFRLEYEAAAFGSADITIRATDSGELYVDDIFHVAVNNPPVANNTGLGAGYFNEDQTMSPALMLSGNPVEPSQTLTFHFADFSSLHGRLYSDPGFATELLITSTVTAMGPGWASVPVYFKPDANYYGPMSFQYYVTDDGGGTNQSANATASAFVMPQNDAPSITRPDQVSTTSGVEIEFSGANLISVSDVEDNGSATYYVLLRATHGTLWLSSTSGLTNLVHTTNLDPPASPGGHDYTTDEITFTATISDANKALNGLKFTPVNDAVNPMGPELATLLIGVNDKGMAGMGGTATGIDNVDILINGPTTTPNHAPVNTVPGAQTTAANTPIIFTGQAFSLSDPDITVLDSANPAAGGGEVGVVLVASSGTLTLSHTDGLSFTNGDGINDARLNIRGTIADINAALVGLTFQPAADFTGTVTIMMGCNDLGNNGTGHPLIDSDPVSITVTGTQNVPPVITVPGPQVTGVNAQIEFIGQTISVANPDAPASDMAVRLASAHGTMTLKQTTGLNILYGGTGVNEAEMFFSGSIDNIKAALNGLIFTPEADYSGWADISISTNDLGNTGLGGPQAAISKIDITVGSPTSIPVNVGPTFYAGRYYVAQDHTPLTFSSANGNQISISDPNAVSTDQLAVKLMASSGGFTLNGTEGLKLSTGDGTDDRIVSFFGTIADINNALNGASFIPDDNFSGQVAISFIVIDMGNSGTGGPYGAQVNGNIWVFAQNDAPVNTVPDSVTATVNTLTAISGISVSDADAGTNDLQVTLSVTHGTLQLGDTVAGGLTAGQISGNGTSSVVLNGTLAQIDATLAHSTGLQYLSALNYTGADTLTVSSNDFGATGSGGALTTVSTVPVTISPWTLEFESTGWATDYWRHADGAGGYDVLFAYNSSAQQYYQHEGSSTSPYGDASSWRTLGDAGVVPAGALLDGAVHALKADGSLTFQFDSTYHKVNYTSTLLGQFYHDFDHSTGDGLWYQKVGAGASDWVQAGETEQVWFQYSADPNHWNLGNGFAYEYHPVYGVSYWQHADGMGGYDVLFAYAHSAGQWYQHEGTTSSPYGTQWYTLGAAGALGANYGLLDGNTHELAAGLSYAYDGMQHRTNVTSTLLGQFYYDFDDSTGDGLWYQKVGSGPSDWAQVGEAEQVWFQYGADPNHWDLGNGFAYEYYPAWGVSYWRQADGMGGYDVLFAYAHSAQQWYQNEGTTSSPYGTQWYTLGAAGALGANYGLLDGNTHQLAAGLMYSYDGMQHRANVTSTLLGQFYYDFDHATGDRLWYQKVGPGIADWAQAGETEQVWFQYGADPNNWNLGNGFAYEYNPAWGVSYWRHADGMGGYDVLFAYAHSAEQWYQNEGTTSSPYGTQWYTLGAAGALGTDYGLLDGNTHQLAAGLWYSYDGLQHRSYVTSTLLGQFYYDFDHSTGDGLWYQKIGTGPSDWAQAGETEQVWFQYGADPNHWNLGDGFAYEYHPAWGVSYWRHADGMGGYDVLFAYAHSAGQWYQHEGTTSSPYGAQWYTLGAAGALGANYGLLDGNTHQVAEGLWYRFDGMQHRANVTSTLLGQFYYDFDHSTGDGLWYQKIGTGPSDWAQAGETEQVWFQYGADPNHWDLGNGFAYEYNPAWGVSYWRHADGMGGYDVLFAYAQGAGQWYQHEGTTTSPYGTQWYTLGAAGALGTDYGLLDGNTHQVAAGLSYRFDAMQHRAYWTSDLLGQFFCDYDHGTGDGLWYQYQSGSSIWLPANETEQVWFQYGPDPNHWALGSGFEYEYSSAYATMYWRQPGGGATYNELYAYSVNTGQWYRQTTPTTNPYGDAWFTIESRPSDIG